MRLLVGSLVFLFLAGAVALAIFAQDEWERAQTLAEEANRLRAEIDDLGSERVALSKIHGSRPVKPAAEALSELVNRAVEVGEVLGAGLRVELRNADGSVSTTASHFAEVRHGLKSASVALETAADLESAPALFSLLEDELGALPVVIRKAVANVVAGTVALRLEVEVFGR
jgi:hypothetical protein